MDGWARWRHGWLDLLKAMGRGRAGLTGVAARGGWIDGFYRGAVGGGKERIELSGDGSEVERCEVEMEEVVILGGRESLST